MAIKFTESFDSLKIRISSIEGTWTEINGNQNQFRSKDGGILNWYPSTGRILFQGPAARRDALEAKVSKLLAVSDQAQQAEPIASAASDVDVQALQTNEKKQERLKVEQEVVEVSTKLVDSDPNEANAAPPDYLGQRYADSELVIGIVGAVGTETRLVIDILLARLKVFGYTTDVIRVSSDIIPQVIAEVPATFPDEYTRISDMMDAGDEARKRTNDNSVLGLGVAAFISEQRQSSHAAGKPRKRHAYIIDSLKHPDEVARLREIYPEGFYLIGVHSDSSRRHKHLTDSKRITAEQAAVLMGRDENEQLPHGQRTSDTFHLSDAFVRIDHNHDALTQSLWRILDIFFWAALPNSNIR